MSAALNQPVNRADTKIMSRFALYQRFVPKLKREEAVIGGRARELRCGSRCEPERNRPTARDAHTDRTRTTIFDALLWRIPQRTTAAEDWHSH